MCLLTGKYIYTLAATRYLRETKTITDAATLWYITWAWLQRAPQLQRTCNASLASKQRIPMANANAPRCKVFLLQLVCGHLFLLNGTSLARPENTRTRHC